MGGTDAAGAANSESAQEIKIRFEDTLKKEMNATQAFNIFVLGNYIQNGFVTKVIDAGITKYMEGIASASFALGFAGKDIHLEDVERLLEAAGMREGENLRDVMQLTNIVRYKNHSVYINAVYFMKFVGKEPDLQTLLKMAHAMCVEMDASIADSMMKFSIEYDQGKHNIESLKIKASGNVTWAYNKFQETIKNYSETMADSMIKDTSKIIETHSEFEDGNPELYACLWAAATLIIAGRDVYEDNLTELMNIVGLRPNRKVIDLILSIRMRNKLVYIISVYYLASLEVEPTVTNVTNVVKVLDIIPDAKVATEAIEYYKQREKK